MLSAEELKRGLENFYGSEVLYRIPLVPFTITEGVQYFVENAEAFWLLTDIGVLFSSKLELEQQEDTFFDIVLLVKNGGAVLTFGDGNGNILYSHTYTYTDCPEGEWKFFLEGPRGDRVLLLPSEH